MKDLTVTIGISAYNEDNNIKKLLSSILSQNQNTYKIDKIIVISDGSNDKTVSECKSINNKKIHVIKGVQRKGKPARLNELFEMTKSDILVQLDADIVLNSKNTISNLIVQFIRNKSLDIVYGTHKALSPRTFSEKLAYFGFEVWDEIRHRNMDLKDFSSGNIRAFSRNFYRKFRFPSTIGSGEDTYCYYYCRSNNLNIGHSKDAIIYIRLASTFKDYLKQMSRNLGHIKTMNTYFNPKTISQYNSSTTVSMIPIIVKKSTKYSLTVIAGFIMLQTFTRIYANFYKSKTIWDIAKSSKQIS